MEVLRISQKSFNEAVKIAEEFIKNGKVLICPTDTVYGLVCDATNEKAVEKIFKIKKRPEDKFLPIFVKNIEMARKLAFINKNQEKYLKKVWPGKVTAVLKSKIKNQKSKIYGVDEETIALRIPKHKLVLELLKKTNKPLTGTSANISGISGSTEIQEILKQFEGNKFLPDLVLDAGNLKPSEASKIVDLTGKKPKILRP